MEVSFINVDFLYERKFCPLFLDLFLYLQVLNDLQIKIIHKQKTKTKPPNNPYAKKGVFWSGIFQHLSRYFLQLQRYISSCDHLITVSVTNLPIDSGQNRIGNALSLVSMLSLVHCRAPPQIQQIHLLDYFDYFLLQCRIKVVYNIWDCIMIAQEKKEISCIDTPFLSQNCY